MVFAKKLNLIIFLILAVFPFGQLFKVGIVSAMDILVFIFILFSFKAKKVKIPKPFLSLFIVFTFSLIFGKLLFQINVVNGFLYLIRLIVYFLFWLSLKNYVKESQNQKFLLLNSLLMVLVFVGVFGWIQYFWYPDFRPFLILNWDDHLGRLIGTFIDPGFTSIFLVFGAIISILFFSERKKYWYLVFFVFFVMSLFFTYSRAGFAAFVGSFIFWLVTLKRFKYFIFLVCFLLILPFLPKFSSEGTNLLRTYSINERIKNYGSGIEVINKSPIFGIGYNNLCEYRVKNFDKKKESHSCSGFDSSLIMILSTTGLTGLVAFIYLWAYLYKDTKKDLYGKMFLISIVALLIHSQFNNSIFYPWVMVVLGLLYSVSGKNYSE